MSSPSQQHLDRLRSLQQELAPQVPFADMETQHFWLSLRPQLAAADAGSADSEQVEQLVQRLEGVRSRVRSRLAG